MTTKYTVLSQQKNTEPVNSASQAAGVSTWKVEKMVDAPTAKAAVALVVKDNGNQDGTFIAVPLRSWRPIKVKAEQKTTITFS